MFTRPSMFHGWMLLLLVMFAVNTIHTPAVVRRSKQITAVVANNGGGGGPMISVYIDDHPRPKQKRRPILLPAPMNLWRWNISINKAYKIPPLESRGRNCSCLNPQAEFNCCRRFIRLSHKMGYVLSHQLFDNYKPPKMLQLSTGARRAGSKFPEGGADYRDVLLFRNIYQALKSGYLYHRTGRECWLDGNGDPISSEIALRRYFHTVRWSSETTTMKKLLPSTANLLDRNRSLCQFLQEEDEKVGMTAYIEHVFRVHYFQALSHWALSRAFPNVRERTQHACYEDFLSPTKDKKAIESALGFLFNTTAMEYKGFRPGATAYDGHHGTSQTADAEQSQRLLEIIRDLDKEIFQNEIEWLDSVLPC